MISVYDANEKEFANNGLKVLKPQKALITKADNGDYYLEVKDSIDFIEYYQVGNIIRTNTPWGYQGFRIHDLEINKKNVSVKALHLYFDTRNYIIKDSYVVDKNCSDALNHLNNACDDTTPFTFQSDIISINSYRCVRSSLEAAIANVIDRWGGHLVRDNFVIEIKSIIGQDRGVVISSGKNLINIDKKEDWNDVVTKILPVGKDGILLPEVYLEVDEKLYDIPYTKVVSFSQESISEDDYKTNDVLDKDKYTNALVDDLRKQALSYLNENKIPKINYTVEADIKNVSDVGDIIYVKHPKCKIDLTTNVISLQYDCILNKYVKIEFGNFKNNLKNLFKRVTSIVDEKIKKINPDSILEGAITKASDLIKNAMGGYVYKTNSELYIMDTNDPKTAKKVWRWNINGLGYSSTGIEGRYETAITMDGSIVADFITTGKINTNLIEGYKELILKTDEINSKISDIADITTSGESEYASVNLVEVNESEPIAIKIHPTTEDISYLYPSDYLYPADDLYLNNRIIRFTNTDTNEVVDYELPDDLLYYDANNYDEFILNYDSKTCSVIKRVEYDKETNKNKLKTTEETINYDFPTIALSAGNYTVSLPGYSNAYLYVQLMASNIYTTQFATKIEMSSVTKSINLEIEKKVDNENYTAAQILMKINGDTSETLIKSDKLDINAIAKFTNDKLASAGSTTINGSNITTGIISTSRLAADVITTGNFSAQKINADNITTGTISTSRLDSDVITTSNFSAQTINAEKITAGTLNADRIPNISADKIKSGTMSANRISGGSLNIGNNTYYLRMQASGNNYTNNPSCSGLTIGKQGLVCNSTAFFKANTNFNGYLNIFNKNLIRIYLGDDTSSSCYTAVAGKKTLTAGGHSMTFYNGLLVAFS